MTSTSQTTPPAAQQASDGHPRGAMFIPDEMLKGLIDQANRELSSSDYYLSFALWFADNEMEGSAAWCRKHSEEERSHAMKIFDHVLKRKAKGKMVQAREQVAMDFNDPVDVWEAAMIQERTNSSHIFSLYNLALSTHDYASKNLLEWFVEEQVEEEAAVMDILTNARALVQTKGLYRDYDAKIVYKKH